MKLLKILLMFILVMSFNPTTGLTSETNGIDAERLVEMAVEHEEHLEQQLKEAEKKVEELRADLERAGDNWAYTAFYGVAGLCGAGFAIGGVVSGISKTRGLGEKINQIVGPVGLGKNKVKLFGESGDERWMDFQIGSIIGVTGGVCATAAGLLKEAIDGDEDMAKDLLDIAEQELEQLKSQSDQ